MLRRQISSLILISAIGFGTASCNNGTKPADDKVNFNPNSAGDSANDTPTPPKDAQYTIVCKVFLEDAHVQDSREAQRMLHESTNLKKWYIVHSADHSTLYYGFYRTMDAHDPADGAEGQRALDDQNTIRAMQDSQGNRIFSESILMPIDSPDPRANPAWDITRSNGYWSVEIAAFKNSTDRKERAVEAVREARKEGIEAYYYHGETASSVCIGSWPEEAAVDMNMEKINDDPNAPVVVTPQPLPSSYTDSLSKQGIKNIAPHVDIVDPTLTDTLSKWKEHSVNGYTLMKDGVPERPFLFKIPKRDPLDTMSPPAADNAAMPSDLNRTLPPGDR